MRRYFLLAGLCVASQFLHAQWSTISSTNHIKNDNAGNVGIGVGSISPVAKLEIAGPALSSAANAEVPLLRLGNSVGENTPTLDITSWRYTAGTSWFSATTRIQQKVDDVRMAFIDFNSPNNIFGISLGTQFSTRLLINSSGNVGIGTGSPTGRLQVNGGPIVTASESAQAYALKSFTSGGSNDDLGIALHDGADANSPYLWIAKAGTSWAGPAGKMVIASSKNAGTTRDLWLYANDNLAPSAPNILIQANTGSVSIGTTAKPDGYKLAVGGNIIAEKVKVQLQPWADFVFEPDYKLPTLDEVRAFILANKHLPGVPSATEVARHGLDLGESQAVLLQKIEELTLYILQQDNEKGKQKDEIKVLQQALNDQQAKLEIMQKQLQKLLDKNN